jgi:NhaA family Na+:H+ antiporter
LLEKEIMSTAKAKGFQRFILDESFSGVVLLAATAIALIWANSAIGESYDRLWSDTYFTIGVGSFELSKPLYYWINDGLMAIFFFLIGLEIKRELLVGDLSSMQKAGLPLVAAVGGMVVPALTFMIFNFNDEVYRNGWAIPMATDIAFALGILAMVGKRVPIGLKIFLTALAIVDDLGAVLSIAIFYTDTIQWLYLGIAFGALIILFLLNMAGVRQVWVYLVIGFFAVWLPLLLSGVHATIAGVLVAFTIPTKRKIRARIFGSQLSNMISTFDSLKDSPDKRIMSHDQLETMDEIKEICKKAESPLQRIEHRLKPFALFVIMPIFALANTGLPFSFADSVEVVKHPVFIGIVLGLVLGKSLGIFGFSWLAIRLKWLKLPDGVSNQQMFGASLLAGIGFTMSLFITDLAFHGDALQIIAKKGIFLASLLAGIVGFIWLRVVSKN